MGNSLLVHWSGLCTFTPKAMVSIPGQGRKISQATQHGQDKINKQSSVSYDLVIDKLE